MDKIYDINGNIILGDDESFLENVTFDHYFDENSSTNYTLIRVFKKKLDGTYQYPFIRNPYETGTVSAYDLATTEGWYLVVNAGIGQGIVIENSTVITDTSATYHAGALPLTIDSNGDLDYIDTNTTGEGQELVNSGIVSAICGFFPLIVDYEEFTEPEVSNTSGSGWEHAQRQIIGQFGNGDYAIITGEGRDYDGSVGWSIAEAKAVCAKHGLKFAYNCDGGGSTQTVLITKNINLVYEGTSGRNVESYFVFNGKDTYQIPNINT